MFLKKQLKNFILNNDKIKNSFFVNLIYILYEFIRHYILSGFKYYRIGKLIQLKRSDTLVILGAGCTINELTESQYRELRNYDVAGLSYSFVLPITQTFYFYESPSFHETDLMPEHADKIIPKVIEKHKKGLLKSLLWKNSENKVFNEHGNLSDFACINVCSILSDSVETLKKLFKFCSKFNFNKFFLIQKRGSVSALVQFSLLLKYKKVIFIGIDLNNNEYFFENNLMFEDYNFKNPYLLENRKRCKNTHNTNDPSIGIPIIDVLKILFKQGSTDFYVSSKNSALASFLPCWKWNKY